MNKSVFYIFVLCVFFTIHNRIDVLDNYQVNVPYKADAFLTLSYRPTDKNYVNYIINNRPYLDDEENEIDDHGITFNQDQDNPVITITSTKFNTIDALVLDKFSETPLLSPNVLAFKEMLKYYYFKSIKQLPEISVKIDDEQNKSLIYDINAMAVFDVMMNKKTDRSSTRFGLLKDKLRRRFETLTRRTRDLKNYIKNIIETCETDAELKNKRELRNKNNYIAQNIPELELVIKQPFLYRNRWLLGGGLLIALITYYVHKKYGIGTIPSRIQDFFKK